MSREYGSIPKTIANRYLVFYGKKSLAIKKLRKMESAFDRERKIRSCMNYRLAANYLSER